MTGDAGCGRLYLKFCSVSPVFFAAPQMLRIA